MTKTGCGKKNLYIPLKRMFKNVTLISYYELFKQNNIASLPAKKKIEIANKKILDIFNQKNKKNNYQIFFSYLHTDNISKDLILQLPKDILKINYTTNFHQFELYKPLLQYYDISIYPSADARTSYEKYSKNSYYMPFAADPKSYRSSINKALEHYSFIGTAYGNRPIYCWRIFQNNIPFHLYGPNWSIGNFKRILRPIQALKDSYFSNSIDSTNKLLNERVIMELHSKFYQNIHGPVSDEDYINILHNSTGIINLPESRYGHFFDNPNVLLGANLRDFEVPMASGLLFTQRNKEIQEFYEEDKEAILFSNELELIDKLSFYLGKPELREKISKAGHKRAISSHTWENRFKLFFDFIDKEIF